MERKTVLIRSRRVSLALRVQAIQHALAGFLLLFSGLETLRQGEGNRILAAFEVATGLLLFAAVIRELRSFRGERHPASARISWVDLFAALLFTAEGLRLAEEGAHRVQYAYYAAAVLMAARSLLHPWLARLRRLDVTERGFFFRGGRFLSLRLNWDEIQSAELGHVAIRITTVKGERHLLELRDLYNSDEVRDALDEGLRRYTARRAEGRPPKILRPDEGRRRSRTKSREKSVEPPRREQEEAETSRPAPVAAAPPEPVTVVEPEPVTVVDLPPSPEPVVIEAPREAFEFPATPEVVSIPPVAVPIPIEPPASQAAPVPQRSRTYLEPLPRNPAGRPLPAVIALTRPVSPRISECQLTHLERSPIHYARACDQHLAYEDVLASLGAVIERLPPEPDLPDSVFIEDTAVVLDDIAVICRPGPESRRPETDGVAAALHPYRSLQGIFAPGTLEGGDVLALGRILFVGRSARTNQAGIDQFRSLVEPLGYEVRPVSVHGCLHLKSAVTPVADDRVLVNPEWVDAGIFEPWRPIHVHPAEPFAANALWTGDAVIYPLAHERTGQRLEESGIRVQLVDVSELAKAEGGVTCCALLVRQHSPR